MKSYKFKNITIKKNGNIISSGDKLDWIDICTKTGFIYLSWKNSQHTGRLYFFMKHIDKPLNPTIKNFKCEEDKLIVSFNYEGDWEEETGGFHVVKVNDLYEVVFNDVKDFNKLCKVVHKFL